MGVVALSLLVPPLRDRIDRFNNSLARKLFARRFIKRWLILSILILVGFWLLRMPINFLSESYGSIRNIGTYLPVQFRWLEGGAAAVVSFMSYFVPLEGIKRGEYAYTVTSVLSGAITVYMFFLIAGEMVEEGRKRLFVFCLLMFSGWILLFFGYRENSPVVWPVIAAYLYYSIRYLNDRGNLLFPSLLLAVSAILNLQALVFIVSYPALLFSRGRGLEIYRKYRILVWSAMGVVLAAAGVLLISHYLQDLEFQRHFLPPVKGRVATPGYAVFSLIHLSDIINLATITMPIWPVLIVLGIRSWHNVLKDPVDRFLLIFSLGGGLFLAVADPSLGMGRDWDRFALSWLGPLLLLSRRAVVNEKTKTILFPGLALLSLVMVFPFLATNLRYPSHMEYVLWQLKVDQPRSKTGLVLLKGYYRQRGDLKTADSLNTALYKHFPTMELMDQAQEYIINAKPAEALDMAEQILQGDSHSFEGYLMRGIARLHTGNIDGAIGDLELTVRLAPYHSVARAHLGQAYEAKKRHEEALKSFREAQKLDSRQIMIKEGLAVSFNSLNRFDSAFFYAKQVIDEDSTKLYACLIAGIAAVQLGDKDNAVLYLDRYISMDPPEQGRNLATELLQRLR